jgi:hypothetical protein
MRLLHLRVWASEAMDVLHEAECAEAADAGPASSACRMRCRHRLAALIDRGTAAPLRGMRLSAVAYLVVADRVLAGTDPDFIVPLSSPTAAVRALRRAFVAEIEDTLDPRTRDN